MRKYILLLLFLLSCLLLFSRGKPDEPTPTGMDHSEGTPGSFQTMDPEDPMAIESKELLLGHFKSVGIEEDKITFLQFRKQVVAGYNVHILFEFNDMEREAEVYFPLNGEPELYLYKNEEGP